MKDREKALRLVEAVFDRAAKRGNRQLITMGLPVLKNRLLDATERQFQTKDFGARSIADFASWLAPELSEISTGLYAFRGFARAAEVRSSTSIETAELPQTAFPMISGMRIREDLWRAFIDYTGGSTYVWDVETGVARKGEPSARALLIPTASPAEIGQWRSDFADEHTRGIGQADLVLLQQWQEQGLPSNYLPGSLQRSWNRALSAKVRERIDNFFTGLGGIDGAQTNKHLQSTEEAINLARARGDGFSVGALMISLASRCEHDEQEVLLAQAVAAWTSPSGFQRQPESFRELADMLGGADPSAVAIAFVNVIFQLDDISDELRDAVNGFAYRMRDGLVEAFGADDRSPANALHIATARLEEAHAQAKAAVARFLRSTPVTAKIVSVDLLKSVARLKKFMVADDQQLANDLTMLLGPAFRKLCEAYERNADADVIRRAPEYLRNLELHKLGEDDPRQRSRVWREFVHPVIGQLFVLVEEASLRGESALAPVLSLRNSATKADLLSGKTELQLSFSLINSGKGAAHSIKLRSSDGEDLLTYIEPSAPFDIPAGGERLVRLCLKSSTPRTEIEIPIEWECATSVDKTLRFEEIIRITQQRVVPDWSTLTKDSPYGTNPIDRPERLYGRSGTLLALHYAAMARTSHFVWGQKRIGKTSLLQVLSANLEKNNDAISILLRMGELTSLHEGQIAWLIASKLAKRMPGLIVPDESEFGAGLGRLIPFVDDMLRANPDTKCVVIIDEFDDLDPALYTGERGKQFIKALRSVSEVGLTFFFVGSERMDAIFSRHQSDLNKWINERLDRIDSREDCRALISDPISGSIEFSDEAIDFIIDYAAGNPFYMHNFCYQILLRCLKEYRTYVDVNDAHAVRHQLLRSLGPTNFAHLWEDNPVLDAHDKLVQSGENCIALCCIASLGGRFESIEDVIEAQETLVLAADERASEKTLREACSRLMKRKIIDQSGGPDMWFIALPLFREWLGQNSIAHLLPIWNEARQTSKPQQFATRRTRAGRDDGHFVIPEDDLLAVAQRLIVYGKQKDVAEIRSWLRQFDDDGRIEIAFALLKRLSERGFINDGMRAVGYTRMAEMIDAHRINLGQLGWKIVKARNDNLAVAYLDAEHKSGATTAREVSRAAKAGKIGPANEMAAWMKQHEADEPILVIADDFAGTGGTLVKGLQKMKSKVPEPLWRNYLESGRLVIIVMYAFSEALTAVREAFPGIQILTFSHLGEDLKACDDGAEIFGTEAERRFAIEILTQIGRELQPAQPLGHGNMGALVVMNNTTPNNSLPIFWCGGIVAERPWVPLFPRA